MVQNSFHESDNTEIEQPDELFDPLPPYFPEPTTPQIVSAVPEKTVDQTTQAPSDIRNLPPLKRPAPTPRPRFFHGKTSPTSSPVSDMPSVDPHDFIFGAEVELNKIQKEMDNLKTEVNQLRRRDDTLKFYMMRLDEELRLAARLQLDFMPKELPQIGNIFFHVLFRPAGYVSGDLYDVIRLDETHVGFFIVDAVGHGMPAALLTMFIKKSMVYKEIKPDGYRLLKPEQTMARVNDALIDQELSPSTFATALYGIIDTKTLQLELVCAGHPTPLLLREKQLQPLSAQGALLGVFANETYTATTIQLQHGDRLIAYSDGVEVAFGADIAAQQGQWKFELEKRIHLPVEGMIMDFSQQIETENGSLQPKDDLTMVVVEVK